MVDPVYLNIWFIQTIFYFGYLSSSGDVAFPDHVSPIIDLYANIAVFHSVLDHIFNICVIPNITFYNIFELNCKILLERKILRFWLS